MRKIKLFSWKKWLSKIFSNFFNCSFMIFICSFAAVSALDYEVNFLFVICIVYCTYLIMLNCKTRLLETGLRRIPLLLDLKNTSTAHTQIYRKTDAYRDCLLLKNAKTVTSGILGFKCPIFSWFGCFGNRYFSFWFLIW